MIVFPNQWFRKLSFAQTKGVNFMPESGTIEGFTSGDATHGAIVSDKPVHEHDKVKNDFTRETDNQAHHHGDHEFPKEEQKQ